MAVNQQYIINNMRQDAIRRAREMQRRASNYSNINQYRQQGDIPPQNTNNNFERQHYNYNQNQNNINNNPSEQISYNNNYFNRSRKINQFYNRNFYNNPIRNTVPTPQPPKPEPEPEPKPEEAPKENPTVEEEIKDNEQNIDAQPKDMPAQNNNFLNSIIQSIFPNHKGKIDTEKILIIALIIILAREGADIKLMAALGYILM